MAIKAIINNTEKEIEQIKNSDEQDIDYVYSRIGDTEVEGELPISIKSIGGNLADYRICGNTVDGESVGDRTANLWDETIIQGGTNNVGIIYDGNPKRLRSDYIFVEPGETYSFASNLKIRLIYSYDDNNQKVSLIRDAPNGDISYTFTVPNAATKIIITVMKRIKNVEYDITPDDFEWGQLEKGSVVTSYEPYGYRVPVTVEGKNLFDFDAFVSSIKETGNGTMSVQGQTITLTASKIDYYTYPYLGDQSGVYKIPVLPNTKYVLSWEADNNKEGRIYVFLNGSISSAQTALQTEKSIKFITQDDTIYATIRFGVYSVGDSITYSNIQLNKGSAVLPYEPYHAPVTTTIYLPEQIKKVGDEAEYIDYSEQKLHRVRKNLLQNQAVDREIEGVTFTVNSDGSITCNGTASDNTNSGSISSSSLPAGSYYLNGTPSGGSLSTYYMYVACYTESEIILYNDVGDGVSFTIDNSCNINVRIAIKSGCTCNNLTFYPMIRKADITDDTYEPYIVNTEVNTNLPALSTIKGTNILSVNTSIQPSNIYIKDSFDYKKVFTATRTIEDELPLNYRSIENSDSTLKNYRIYGNTVGGESVGDRTGNLFDEFSVHGMVPSVSTGELTNSPSRGATTDLIPIINGDITLSKSNAVQSNMYIFLYAQDKSYVGYTQTMVADTLILYGNSINGYQNAKYARIRVDIESAYTQTNIMLNTGSTALPYEPYGYKVPVTVEGKNLFDFGEWSKNINANDGNSLAKGIDDITITANSNDAFTTPYANVHAGIYKIYVKPNTNYLLSWASNNILSGRVFIFKNGISDQTHAVAVNNDTTKYLLFGTDADTEFITLRFGVQTAGNTITYSKIMLIEGSTTLPYEPYHAPVTTNLYLPEQIKMVGDEAEYIDYKEQKQHRVRKNLLQTIATSRTINDITFTVNANGSVTCNGTNHGNNPIIFELNNPDVVFPEGVYITSGCPAGGSITDGYKIQYFNGSSWSYDLGRGSTFTLSGNLKYRSRILISKDVTVTNLTFYPMLRLASIEDDTYEPYIENTDLDVTLPALPTLTGTNVLSVGTAVQPSKVYVKGKIKEVN